MPLPLRAGWSLLAALCVGGFYLGHRGYSGDQETYFILAFRTLYPDFALGDWYTYETGHYHFAYTWLVQALHALGALDWWLFLGWFLCLWLMFFAIAGLVAHCEGGPPAFVATVPMITLYANLSLGDSQSLHENLLPSSIGFALTVAALERLLARKIVPALALSGLAGLFHVNYVIFMLPLCVLWWLWEKGELRPIGAGAAACLVLSSPTLALTASNFGVGSEGLLAYVILRSGHHYDPGLFPFHQWLQFALAGLLVAVLGPRTRSEQSLDRMSLLIVGMLAAALVNFLVDGPETITRAYAWRLAPAALILFYVRLGVRLTSPEFSPKRTALVLLGLFVGAAYGFRSSLLLAGLLVVLVGALRLARGAALPWVLVGVLWLGTTVPGQLVQGRSPWPFNNLVIKADQPHLAWMRTQTPPGARFLVPPDMHVFRILSHRATLANFKGSTIASLEDSYQWTRRMAALAGMSSEELLATGLRSYPLLMFLTSRYLTMPAQDVVALMKRELCDYYVTHNRWNGWGSTPTGFAPVTIVLDEQRVASLLEAGLKPVYQDAEVTVFRLPEAARQSRSEGEPSPRRESGPDRSR